MKRIILFVSLSLLFVFTPNSTFAENQANEKFYLSDVFHSCYEQVAFEGNVHYLQNTTVDGHRGYHVKIQWNYVNVKGIGLTSGVQYIL